MAKVFIILCFVNCHCFAQNVSGRKAKANYELGEKYFNEGDWQGAMQYLDSCIVLDPFFFEAYYTRAIAKERVGDIHGAIADYGVMIHLDPDFTESYWNRAILYFEVEYYELSNTDLYSLLQIPENETNAIYFRTRYPDNGVSGVATLESMEAQIYNQLGLVAQKMEKYNLAIAHFTRSLELFGYDADFLVNRSLAYESTQQFACAENDLRLAKRLDPDNSLVNFNLARIEEASGKNSQVIASYTSIIEQSPEFSEAYAKRGIAKLKIGDLEGAKSDYDSALIYGADDPLIWMNRGIVQHRMKRFHEAASDLSKALELNPALENAYFNRGNSLMKMEQFERAINDYNSAILYYPSFAMAYYNRGIAYHRNDQLEEACKNIQKAMDLGVAQAKTTLDKMCK